MQNKPHFSIVIPYHDTLLTAFFLQRLLTSINEQSLKDYEIILVREGLPGQTINAGIRKAKGELIKIMCMDDWFAPKNALMNIADSFKGNWQICGSHDNPHPYWTDKVPYGYNTLGGLSSITMKNDDPVLFDDNLKWMIDVEFYHRAFMKWGEPTILDGITVNIGTGDYQLTRQISDTEKQAEFDLVAKRFKDTEITYIP